MSKEKIAVGDLFADRNGQPFIVEDVNPAGQIEFRLVGQSTVRSDSEQGLQLVIGGLRTDYRTALRLGFRPIPPKDGLQ